VQQKAVEQGTFDDPKDGADVGSGGARRNREQRLTQIILAARQTFLEDGYAGFATRGVASRVGITLGNLQYYFRTKEDLLRATLHANIRQIASDYTAIANQPGISAARRCSALIQRVFHDINETDLRKFLFEVWAFAQHEPYAAELLDDMYSEYRGTFARLLSELHPSLTGEESLVRASVLGAQTAGMMIFADHGGESEKDYAEFVRVTKRAVKMLVGLSPQALGNETRLHGSRDRGADGKLDAHAGMFDSGQHTQRGVFELSVRQAGQDILYYRPTVQGKRREVKINEIVSAAADLLATGGYANFTLARVARELGIPPSALQNYFPTHDELLHATIDALMKAYLSRYAEMSKPSEKPALERLLGIVDDGLKESRDPNACRFSFELRALAQHSDVTRELLKRLYSAYRMIFVDLVRELDSSATARECQARATLIAAQIEGMTTLMFGFRNRPADIDRIFDFLETLTIRIASGDIPTKDAV
jgi:AcrR family transcriptional regulator